MHITLDHKTEQKTAIGKIDNFLTELMKKDFPAGVKIKDLEKNWDGSKMRFSFKAKKGFLLSVTLKGLITVTENEVIMDCEVPGIVTTFVAEDKIKEIITNQVNEIFA